MKVIPCIIIFLISFSFPSEGPHNDTLLKFEKRHIDLGTIKKGDIVESEFVFTNSSGEEVFIDLVSACECTEVDWPFQGILPGEKDRIHFVFDSNKKDTSDTIELDIYLRNLNPETGDPILEIVSYSFQLVE